MKEKIKVSILLWVFFTAGVQGFSQQRKTSFHAGGLVAFSGQENIHPKPGSSFGFTISVIKNFSLSVDFFYWRNDVDEVIGGLYKGQLNLTPIMLSVQYNILKGNVFSPYVFLGTEYVFSSFKMGEYNFIPEISIKQDIKNGIGVHAGIGGLINIKEPLSLFAEALYLFRKSTIETTITDLDLGTRTEFSPLDLSSMILRIGIKYSY